MQNFVCFQVRDFPVIRSVDFYQILKGVSGLQKVMK